MRKVAKHLFIWSLAIGLFLPFLIIAGVSLNADKNISLPPSALSLKWYAILVTGRDWLIPIRNSIVIAVFASLIAVSVALAANYVL